MSPPTAPAVPRLALLSLGVIFTAPAALNAQRQPNPSAATVAVIERIAATQTVGRYSHSTRVDPASGRYEWDCSAMAAWVLRQSAPGALASLHSGRPLAVDFYRAIARAPALGQGGAAGPWRRVPRLSEAQPGDVLAWPRPRWFPSRNTGHVAFVMAAPTAVAGGVLLRIADATSLPHASDARTASGATGFGQGVLRVDTDPATGAGIAYGWIGDETPREWMIATPVVIGRALR
ncbi:MAG: CHAP domain-containing protein [Myxococcales bacterium]|nr:CHAP domain-containing protein [Myxococcales bacterium]